jgi:hypothetical protein
MMSHSLACRIGSHGCLRSAKAYETSSERNVCFHYAWTITIPVPGIVTLQIGWVKSGADKL